ncbi:MAG: phosphoserine/homoserine phosphotransferase [Bacteroidia bacterium]|jgi:phosphoserine/homoserine phosphotransferase
MPRYEPLLLKPWLSFRPQDKQRRIEIDLQIDSRGLEGMNIVCLDLEGVLIPEIWIAFAEKTGIEALKRTTRDEPCYDTLMRYRLDILDKEGFKLADIEEVIGTLDPLPGAQEFVTWVTSQTRLVILSDTFSQFAGPLMAKLGNPTLFCHDLVIDETGRIADYKLRLPDHKRKAVEAFRALNFDTIAAGDSYNDLSMIDCADEGLLFCPPERLTEERPELQVARNHAELQAIIAAKL